VYLVAGDFRAAPEHRSAFVAAIGGLAADMRRLEPGFVRMQLIEDRGDSGRFLVLEFFEDQAASAFHREQAHSKDFVELEKASGWGPRPTLLFEGQVSLNVG
jgi:quinol monooxygenase YgiN